MRVVYLLSGACVLAGILGFTIYDRNQLRRELTDVKRVAARQATSSAAPRAAQQVLVVTHPNDSSEAEHASPSEGKGGAPAPSQQQEPAPPTDEERALAIQNAFDSESYDASWALETRRTVEASLRDRPGILGVGDVACKSALCRVKVSHRDESELMQFQRGVVSMDRRLWPGEMFFQPPQIEPSGAVTSVVFLLRPGAGSPLESPPG
jgi:hypothetical protein